MTSSTAHLEVSDPARSEVRPPNLQSPMFERPDWMDLRTVEGVARRAGVSVPLLARVVLKELADNALDAGPGLDVRRDGPAFMVSDLGPGLPGSDEEIAALFSIGRDMTSTKHRRLPNRGALGNGLRVVAGAVLASGGTLKVATSGRVVRLAPKDDGTTAVERIGTSAVAHTTVIVTFGPSLSTAGATTWADWPKFAGGDIYKGKTSPRWYTSEAFYEARAVLLVQFADSSSLPRLLDGCTGAKAGTIAAPFQGRRADSLTREEADTLLQRAQELARPVKAARLGCVGRCPASQKPTLTLRASLSSSPPLAPARRPSRSSSRPGPNSPRGQHCRCS